MDNERQEVAVMGFRLPGSTSQKMVTISEELLGAGGLSQGETRALLSPPWNLKTFLGIWNARFLVQMYWQWKLEQVNQVAARL